MFLRGRSNHPSLRHATLLEEYRSLRSEIVCLIQAEHQMTQLGLTIVAGLIAATPFILQLHVRILLLVAPLLLCSLTWIELRYVAMLGELGDYLRFQLIRVRLLWSDAGHAAIARLRGCPVA